MYALSCVLLMAVAGGVSEHMLTDSLVVTVIATPAAEDSNYKLPTYPSHVRYRTSLRQGADISIRGNQML